VVKWSRRGWAISDIPLPSWSPPLRFSSLVRALNIYCTGALLPSLLRVPSNLLPGGSALFFLLLQFSNNLAPFATGARYRRQAANQQDNAAWHRDLIVLVHCLGHGQWNWLTARTNNVHQLESESVRSSAMKVQWPHLLVFSVISISTSLIQGYRG